MVENIGRGFTTMMFSYQKAKNILIFAIITIGAIATVGIVATADNSANDSTNDLFTFSGESGYNEPLGFDDGGGVPASTGMLLGFDDGGGVPA